MLEAFSQQMNLTGDAAQAVMISACEILSGSGAQPKSVSQMVREGKPDGVRVAYLSATDKLRTAKPLLRFLDTDPLRWFHPCSKNNKENYICSSDASVFITRNFRVIQNIILVDSLVRNNRRASTHAAILSNEELTLISDVGTMLKSLLLNTSVNGFNNEEDTDAVEADAFFKFKQVRECKNGALLRHTKAVQSGKNSRSIFDRDVLGGISERDWIEMLSNNDIVPLLDYDSEEYGLALVLGMVEHLIIRSIRLRYAWKWFNYDKVDEKRKPPKLGSQQFRTTESFMKKSTSEAALADLVVDDSGEARHYNNEID